MLTYEEQVDKLKNLKNIQIFNQCEEEILREYLNKYSYYNFINSTKKFFISHEENNKYIYLPSNALEWTSNFDKQMRVGNEILLGILEIEKELNSFLSYNLTMQSRAGALTVNSREIQMISSSLKKYTNNRYSNEEILDNLWKFVPTLTLGTLLKIFDNKKYSTNKKLKKILEKFHIQHKQKQGALNILRNGLAHNTPLLIVMCYDNKDTRSNMRKISKEILTRKPNILSEFNELDVVSQQYLMRKNIKKNLTN